MPWRMLEGIHAQGKKVFLIAVPDLTDPALAAASDEVLWLRYPKLRRVKRECQKRHIREFALVGRIPHSRLFTLKPWQLDLTALRLFLTLPDFRADTLLGAIADQFSRWNMELINTIRYLKPFLAKQGVLTKKGPSPTALGDIEFGLRFAKELGRLDIGQTIVIKNRAIVAVEAMEGTDACIQRAGDIAGPGCVIIKMAKPAQDGRFDVPVIGVNTIEKCAKIEAAALAIEGGRTLLIDKETLSRAEELGVSVIGLPLLE